MAGLDPAITNSQQCANGAVAVSDHPIRSACHTALQQLTNPLNATSLRPHLDDVLHENHVFLADQSRIAFR
jgi:hypothetical protein